QFRNVQYLSTTMKVHMVPGTQSNPSSAPTPSCTSLDDGSSSPRSNRTRKWRTSRANGCSSSQDGRENVLRHPFRIHRLRQLHESGLEAETFKTAAHLIQGAGRHYRTLLEQHQVCAELLHLFQDRG